jgi:hypothetical protein
MIDLHIIAGALSGKARRERVLARGSGHTCRDRSLSVRLSANAPDVARASGRALPRPSVSSNGPFAPGHNFMQSTCPDSESRKANA